VTVARRGIVPCCVSGDRDVRPPQRTWGWGCAARSIFENAIEEDSFDLQGRRCLCALPDGLTEARREEDEFGYDERLLETTRNVRDRTAAEIKDAILSRSATLQTTAPTTTDVTW